MGKGLQRWLRPLPMGLLAALLSALVLLPTLLGVAAVSYTHLTLPTILLV